MPTISFVRLSDKTVNLEACHPVFRVLVTHVLAGLIGLLVALLIVRLVLAVMLGSSAIVIWDAATPYFQAVVCIHLMFSGALLMGAIGRL